MNQILLPVVLPLLAAFLMQPLAQVSRLAARALGPLVLVLSALITARIWLGFGEAPFTVAIGGFAPPLGIVFYADHLALLFALTVPLFTLLFWPGLGDQDSDPGHCARRDALVLLLVAAATGLALSGDLFNIYIFYELAAVASFGLASLTGTPRALVATLRYLLISAFGSVLSLVGISFLYMATGTLNLAQLAQLAPQTLQGPLGLASFALMLIGFGVKAELFPLNTWVPDVYATAPARVAALLAGLVSKLAVLVVVRLLVLMFQQPEASQLLLSLGVLGVLTGELAAWRARDFARMIAFSSIGQLGIVFIAFSIDGDTGLLAGIAVALHHLIVKSALFGLAARWNGSLEALTGAARRSPLAAGLFVLFALSLIGVPPLPGFWAKILVLVGLAQGGSTLQLFALVSVLLVTAVEASYLFRVAVRLYGQSDSPPAPPARWDLGAATLLGAALIGVTLATAPVADHLRNVARQAGNAALYVDTVFPKTVAQKD
ncbi:MAG: Na+/H+ antiporter subunit [Chromatiaceae bacterium]|nr:Na+/H+ antiporter subunit [Chromatiaceae bacterium]